MYSKGDAERAIRLADKFLKWASSVEDLPDPGVVHEEVDYDKEAERMYWTRKRRWSALVGEANNKSFAEPDEEYIPKLHKTGSFVTPTSKFGAKGPAPATAPPKWTP